MDTDLKTQARRLRTLLREDFGQDVTPVRALHLTSRLHGHKDWQTAKALRVQPDPHRETTHAPAPAPADPLRVFVLWSYDGDLWFYGGGGQQLNFYYRKELASVPEACRLIRNAVHAACGRRTRFIHKDARFLTDLMDLHGGEFEGLDETSIIEALLTRHGPAWLDTLAEEPGEDDEVAPYTEQTEGGSV